MANSSRSRTVVIADVTLVRSTRKAGCYELDGDEFWIPWSQLREGSVDKDGESGDIKIPLWLAEEKELEYNEDDD
jgi:hypothetical protein